MIQPAAELGDNLLPRVNLVASLLKRRLTGTHQGAVSPEHLDYYLDEFTFRFNRRNSGSRGLLFYRLLEQAVVLPPVKGAELVGGRQITTGSAQGNQVHTQKILFIRAFGTRREYF